MEANKFSCQACGSISFTKTDKTAKCDYCGAEYNISQLQARTAKLDAEQKAIDSLADDIFRLRQLADRKEAERQKAIEEEEKQRLELLRQQKEAQKAYEAAQKEKEEEIKRGLPRFIFSALFTIVYCRFFVGPFIIFLADNKMPTAVIVLMILLPPLIITLLLFPPKKKKK